MGVGHSTITTATKKYAYKCIKCATLINRLCGANQLLFYLKVYLYLGVLWFHCLLISTCHKSITKRNQNSHNKFVLNRTDFLLTDYVND